MDLTLDYDMPNLNAYRFPFNNQQRIFKTVSKMHPTF